MKERYPNEAIERFCYPARISSAIQDQNKGKGVARLLLGLKRVVGPVVPSLRNAQNR